MIEITRSKKTKNIVIYLLK